MKRSEAVKLRSAIEQAAVSLDDKTASGAPSMFPQMEYDGKLIRSGTRINWYGTLKRAAVDLWDMEEYNPGRSPDLWEDILYRDGVRIIPTEITVGLAFSNGERGWWGDELYESIVDNNVYTPEQYAPNWKRVK